MLALKNKAYRQFFVTSFLTQERSTTLKNTHESRKGGYMAGMAAGEFELERGKSRYCFWDASKCDVSQQL